jgi:hypothetical protein
MACTWVFARTGGGAYAGDMKRPAAPAPKHKSKAYRPPGRMNRAVSVALPLRKVTKPLIKKHGFSDPQIFHQWREIVGDQLAKMSCPMKLSRQQTRDARGYQGGATLKVRVAGAAALEFEHMAPQIIERINTFYGYKAVARISLEQGPLPRRKREPKRFERKLTPSEEAQLKDQAKVIKNTELRQSLENLGRAIKSTSSP